MNGILLVLLLLILIFCVCYLCFQRKEGFLGATCSDLGSLSTKRNFQTLALYHGGCAGCNYFTDTQWKQYCAAYWSFVRHAGINKAMFNLTDAGAKDVNARHGINILKYWIGGMPADLKSCVKIGFTVYPSTKSPWHWAPNLKGQIPGQCVDSWDYKKQNDGSVFNPLSPGDTSKACAPYNAFKKADAYCNQQCTDIASNGTWCEKNLCHGAGCNTISCAPDVISGADITNPNPPAPGCPNNWEQIMNYISYVNSTVKDNTPKISFIVIDGEGEGGYTIDKDGFCPLMSAIKYGKANYSSEIPQDFSVGVAHGPGNFCSGGTYPKGDDTCQIIGTDQQDSSNTSGEAYPEIYWYGELGQCAAAIKSGGGSLASAMNQCSDTIYQDHINDPQGLFAAITSGSGQGQYLGSILPKNPSDMNNPSNIYHYKQTYPMFSTENINKNSGKGCTSGLNPKGGQDQCCIANYFYGEANSCGSFNGFGNWDLDKFMEFMNLWSEKFGSQSIAIYEWAFIPTKWVPDFAKIMGTDPSKLPSGSITPSHSSGSVTPSHSSGGNAPSHSSGSITPSHSSGGNAPSHSSGSVTPSHSSGSVTPSHSSGGNAPSHSSGSVTPMPVPRPPPTQSNRKLFLIPEAFGFNVPEINNQVEILPTSSISKHFDSIVVCANSAKYVPGKYDSNPSPPNNVMTDQWENQKVKDLKLPIEKWAFVCCNASVPASTKINNLLKDYPYIEGFIMDFEDPKSVTAFSTEFKKLKKKYKFGLIGFRGNLDGWKSWASQHGGLSFDYYFNELYTEGMYEGQTTSFYNTGKDADSPNNAVCPLNDKASINKFWKSASKSCNGTTTIPTVCGSGNCQEVIWGTINDVGTKNNIKYECFDERLSGKFIMDLVDGKTQDVAGGNFAIWYGTGQAKPGSTTDKKGKVIYNPVSCKPTSTGDWGCAVPPSWN